MRTGNPALSLKPFDVADLSGEKMTLSGTVDKTALHGESLKNGSLVDAVDAWYYEYGSPDGVDNGAASVVDFRPGTSSKYVRFHWWFGYLAKLDHGASLIVSGPKGLPPE